MWTIGTIWNNLGAIGTAIGKGLSRAVDVGRNWLHKAGPYVEIARSTAKWLSHAPIPVVRDVAAAVDMGLGLYDTAVGRLSPVLDSIGAVGRVIEDVSSTEGRQLD